MHTERPFAEWLFVVVPISLASGWKSLVKFAVKLITHCCMNLLFCTFDSWFDGGEWTAESLAEQTV